jgi:hypothetical protein
MASSRRRALAGAVVVAALGLAGCGGGGGAADSATASTSTATATSDAPTSESTTTTTAAPTEEEAILAAYQGYWDTWLAANDPPNPDHPDLAKYATGAALENERASIAENLKAGIAFRLRRDAINQHEASAGRVANHRVAVRDCAIDDGLIVDSATGTVLDDEVFTRLYVADLVEANGEWRVEKLEWESESPGVTACAS